MGVVVGAHGGVRAHRLSRRQPTRSRRRRLALWSRLSSSSLAENLVRQWRFVSTQSGGEGGSGGD